MTSTAGPGSAAGGVSERSELTAERASASEPSGVGVRGRSPREDGVSVAPPLPAGRRAVLYAVRQAGDATVEEIADALDITLSGARQQLSALVECGLLAFDEVPRAGQRGRPRFTYHVTDLADALFPKAYGALTNELLGYLGEDDDGSVDRLFARRREHRIEAAESRLAPLRSLDDKVVELAQILDEDGYMATAETLGRGRFRVVEHNCAIAAVARRYGQACASEIEFIRAVLPEASVERMTHMVAGDRHCGYEIVARELLFLGRQQPTRREYPDPP
jgi:predicted ArsR family transcriptional regulator